MQSKVGAAQVPSTGAYRRTQIATMMAKKSWPREAWAMVAHGGMTNRTAMPPRAACVRTTATAAQARRVALRNPAQPEPDRSCSSTRRRGDAEISAEKTEGDPAEVAGFTASLRHAEP